MTKHNKKKLGTVTFFAGAGFLDLGFENEGFESLIVDEFNIKFLDAYKYARQKMGIKSPIFGHFENSVDDFLVGSTEASRSLKKCMTAVKNSHLVGFIGGPPCPDFSVGGKNRGHKGDRGRLTKSYFDLIRANPD